MDISQDFSQQLAAIIGPLFLVVGLGSLLNPDHYRKMLSAFLEDAELYYFSGALALVIGLAMVLYHNIWVADWRVAITIIGWMSLIKGAVRILFPTAGTRVAASFATSNQPIILSAFLLLGLGSWLALKAFSG